MSWLEHAVGLTLAADTPAADTASQGPVIVVLLAVVTLVGTGVTAAGPVLLEMVKNRGKSPSASTAAGSAKAEPEPKPSTPTLASTQMVENASAGLTMVEAAVLDYRTQRDAAQRRYELVLGDLAGRDTIIRDQAVYIATLESRLGISQNYNGRHQQPSYPPQNWNSR